MKWFVFPKKLKVKGKNVRGFGSGSGSGSGTRSGIGHFSVAFPKLKLF